MAGEKNQLVLIGSRINTKDFFPVAQLEGKTFNDLIEILFDKYEEPILSYATEHFGPFFVATRDKRFIEFDYVDAQANIIHIEPSEEVLSIIEPSDSTVYWTIMMYGN